MTSHNKAWKESQLNELKVLVKEYPVVAVADLALFPASLSKTLRKKLAGKATIKVSKTRVIKMALKDSEKKELLGHAKNSCALIFTKMNPFELFAFMKKNKGSVAAKEGSVAENDIIIPAGDTGLPPGPALSDLKAAGLKVKIEGATISIQQDKVVAKAGEKITASAANALTKLDIKPMKVGINVIAAFEDGIVYLKALLDIDIDEVFNNFVSAQKKSFNLAFNAAYPAKEVLPFLIGKAFNDAKSVALEGNVICEATVGGILAKADAQAKALKGMVKEEAPAETQTEVPAEEKAEETKEEAKSEETKPAEKKPEKAKEETKKEAPVEEAKKEVKKEKKEDDA